MKECPADTFKDSRWWRCQACHSSCLTCHGPGVRDCDRCSGWSRPVYGKCPVINCPEGQYVDGEKELLPFNMRKKRISPPSVALAVSLRLLYVCYIWCNTVLCWTSGSITLTTRLTYYFSRQLKKKLRLKFRLVFGDCKHFT